MKFIFLAMHFRCFQRFKMLVDNIFILSWGAFTGARMAKNEYNRLLQTRPQDATLIDVSGPGLIGFMGGCTMAYLVPITVPLYIFLFGLF